MNVSVTRIREFLLRDEIDYNDISHIENEGNYILLIILIKIVIN
jgi:hypothetical protein